MPLLTVYFTSIMDKEIKTINTIQIITISFVIQIVNNFLT